MTAKRWRRQAALLLLSVFCLVAGAAFAAPVGEVEAARGAGVVQRNGKIARLLGRGLLLEQGDVVTTGPDSSAVLRFVDGTRVTLRPNSRFQVQAFEYQRDGADKDKPGAMVFNLIRGGMRTLTGALPKQGPEVARVVSGAATLGIRGTDFDVRVCAGDEDCPLAGFAPEQARPLASPVSARVLVAQGELGVVGASGARRILVAGGPLYPGDVIETAGAAHAVLAFRDDTRLTLQPASRLRLDDFVFDPANPGEGRFLVTLLAGGLRSATGQIGRADARHAGVRVGSDGLAGDGGVTLRGGGFDLERTGGAGAVLIDALPWDGGLELVRDTAACAPGAPDAPTAAIAPTASTALIANPAADPARTTVAGVAARQAVRIALSGCAAPLPGDAAALAARFATPRPDTVGYAPERLWRAVALPELTEGLFVHVRDGHVALMTPDGTLDLGREEAGYAGPARAFGMSGGRLLRIDHLPAFLRNFCSGPVLELARESKVAMMCYR